MNAESLLRWAREAGFQTGVMHDYDGNPINELVVHDGRNLVTALDKLANRAWHAGQQAAYDDQARPMALAPKDGTKLLVELDDGGVVVAQFSPADQLFLVSWDHTVLCETTSQYYEHDNAVRSVPVRWWPLPAGAGR
jgi:hypothetical protein